METRAVSIFNKIITHLRSIFTGEFSFYSTQLDYITKFCSSFICPFVYLHTCFYAYHDFWKLENRVFR